MIDKQILRGCIAALAVVSIACGENSGGHDASGVFEAREVTIAAEVPGQVIEMNIEEGQELPIDMVVAKIDCKQLELQRAQINASDLAIVERTTEAQPQLDILREQQKATTAQLSVQREQIKVLERERKRFVKLVAAQAAPTKQLADIEGKIAVLRRQMAATSTQVSISKQQRLSYSAQVALQNRASQSARVPTQARAAQIDDQIQKCTVLNPIAGTVLTKYTEQYEFAVPGKPLYKIADLSTLILRAYITGDQLSSVKLRQSIRVFVDSGPDSFHEMSGTLIWISSKAEFTPKTIQTKTERSNLVYPVKIKVPNDGSLKIGMYAEISL